MILTQPAIIMTMNTAKAMIVITAVAAGNMAATIDRTEKTYADPS